jgi:hypothetical protein
MSISASEAKKVARDLGVPEEVIKNLNIEVGGLIGDYFVTLSRYVGERLDELEKQVARLNSV